MSSPFPPGLMRALPPREVVDAGVPLPAPHGLRTHRHPVALGQRLRRQRRPKISIALRIQIQSLGLERLRDPCGKSGHYHCGTTCMWLVLDRLIVKGYPCARKTTVVE